MWTSFKTFVKKYGVFGLSTYTILYVGTLIPMKAVISSNPVYKDIILQKLGSFSAFEPLVATVAEHPEASDWAIALVCTDLLEVIRIPLTIFIAKSFVNFRETRRQAKVAQDSEEKINDKS